MLIYEIPEDWDPNPTQFTAIELENQYNAFMERITHENQLFDRVCFFGMEVLNK